MLSRILHGERRIRPEMSKNGPIPDKAVAKAIFFRDLTLERMRFNKKVFPVHLHPLRHCIFPVSFLTDRRNSVYTLCCFLFNKSFFQSPGGLHI